MSEVSGARNAVDRSETPIHNRCIIGQQWMHSDPHAWSWGAQEMKGDIGISEIGLALAIALGAIAPIVVNRSIELAGISKDVPFLAVSAVVFGAVGTLSTYLIRAPLSVVAVLVYGGIAVGIVADSAIDQFAFSREHDLLPQEIVAMWTIALIPVAAGLLLGERMRGRGAARSAGPKH